MAGPGGYQIGNAWVQVLPSFDNFQKRVAARLAKVGDVEIPAELNLDTGKAEVAARAVESTLTKRPIKLQTELDTRALDAQLAKIQATKDAKVIKLDLDISDLHAKLAELNRHRDDLKIDVDAEITKAEAKIHALEAERHRVVIQADADTANAERKLNQVDDHLRRIGSYQTDINMEAGDASRAVAILGVLIAALGAVTYAAPAAAAAVAAVPTAVLAAGQAIGTVAAGFHGIGGAVKALQAVEDQAAGTSRKAADQRVSAANRVANAQASLQTALEGADHSAILGARQVADAREAAARAQIDAAEQVASAERTLQDAQRSARDAQIALNDARRDAKERLEDLRTSVAGAAIDEERAAFTVDKARAKLQAAQKAGLKGDDLKEVDLAYREAAQRLTEVQDRYADVKTEATQANRAGVNGSREVVAAQRAVQDSTAHVHDAEADLARTRTEGAQQVARAQQAVARAQQDASYAATTASRQVADAQRAIAEASVSAGTTGSAALDKLDVAMAKLTPQGRKFAKFVQDEAKPALQDLGAAAQETLLPKLQQAFGSVIELAPIAQAAMHDTGNVLGDLAIKGAEMVSSGPWKADFINIAKRNNRILAATGDAGLAAADGIRNITVVSGPMVEGLFDSIAAWIDQRAQWLQAKRDSGELATWFREMGARIREVWELVKQFAGGAVDLLQALAPLGKAILHIVAPVAEFIGNLAEANPTLTTIIALMVLLGSGFVSLFRSLGGLSQAWRSARGVFDSMVFGQRDAKKANDETTGAIKDNTSASEKWRKAVDGNTGVVGRVSTGLRSVRDAYNQGASAAGRWGTAVGTSVVTGVSKVDSALARTVDNLAMVNSAGDRAAIGTGRVSGVMVSGFSRVAAGAGGVAVAIGKGVTGAVSGLVGALGGPWGVALTLATVGLGFLASAQEEAARSAAEHKAKVQTLTDALVESNGVIDEHITKLVNDSLQEDGVAASARHFGLNVGEMARAIADGGDKLTGFEASIRGIGNQIAADAHLPAEYGDSLNDLIGEVLNGGLTIDEFADKVNQLGEEYMKNTHLSDDQKKAILDQLGALSELLTGYSGARGDFNNARQGQVDLKDAQNDAATATERHATALHELNNAALESVNKALAYRSALAGLKDAQSRVDEAETQYGVHSKEANAARQDAEQKILALIAATGELAYANSHATTEEGKKLAADQAMIDKAIELANNFKGPLPTALQQYLTSIGAVKTATGEWVALVRNAPNAYTINVNFNDKLAKQRLKEWEDKGFSGFIASGVLNKTPGPGRVFARNAAGNILAPYADGGFNPMSGSKAAIVPPNTFRLIGDRMTGDEAFIPLDKSPRSIQILTEAAARMGFSLAPMFLGGLLAMADGGAVTAGATPATAGVSPGAALVLEPQAVDAFTTATQNLVVAGLAPLAAEVSGITVPALVALENHAGTLSPAAVNKLIVLLPVLQNAGQQTAQVLATAWARIVGVSNTSVAQVRSYLAALGTGLSATSSSMTNMANAAQTQFGRVRPAAADPIRWVLQNPVNAGLIAAWSRLNSDFALKKPVRPVPVPFAFGGRVPGFGNGDTVDAKLTPGEYVLSKPAIATMGGVSEVDRMHRMARAGKVTSELGSTKSDALAKLKLMRTVPLDGLGFAYGGVQPHVARAGHEIEQKFGALPGGIGGVGSRPNESDHPFGLALDFMTLQNTSLGDRIAQYLQTNSKRLLVKYLIWKQMINQGSAWTPMEDRGSITANHFDHVHSSFLRFGQAGKQFTGAGPGADVETYFAKALTQLGQVPRLFPGNKAGDVAAKIMRQAVDGAIRYANDKVGSSQTAGSPEVTAAVRAVANTFGWGSGTEWSDLSKLISGESGWDPKAANPNSSARGLFQKLTSMHGPIEPTVTGQAKWGLRYIKDSYGTPSNAYRQWLSRSPHWYDEGGWLPPGYSTVFNGTGRPEAVLTHHESRGLMSMAGNDSGGAFTGNLYLSSGEWLGAVRGEIDQANVSAGRSLASRLR